MPSLKIKLLGQSGCILSLYKNKIMIDPYLSNSAEKLINKSLKRMQPINFNFEEVVDVNFVIITHDHIDHCDPWTINKIKKINPNIKYIGPIKVIKILKKLGIKSKQIQLAQEKWINLSEEFRIKAIPACHPNIIRDKKNNLLTVGYLIKNRFNDSVFYHSGDTCIDDQIINIIKKNPKIKLAFLPVNENNFFRNKNNIIGNMSIREAFQFCDEIGIPNLVPLHWDMFKSNCAYPEEMKLIYEKMNFKFKLILSKEFEI